MNLYQNLKCLYAFFKWPENISWLRLKVGMMKITPLNLLKKPAQNQKKTWLETIPCMAAALTRLRP